MVFHRIKSCYEPDESVLFDYAPLRSQATAQLHIGKKLFSVDAIRDYDHSTFCKSLRFGIGKPSLRIDNDEISETGQPALNTIQKASEPIIVLEVKIRSADTPNHTWLPQY